MKCIYECVLYTYAIVLFVWFRIYKLCAVFIEHARFLGGNLQRFSIIRCQTFRLHLYKKLWIFILNSTISLVCQQQQVVLVELKHHFQSRNDCATTQWRAECRIWQGAIMFWSNIKPPYWISQISELINNHLSLTLCPCRQHEIIYTSSSTPFNVSRTFTGYVVNIEAMHTGDAGVSRYNPFWRHAVCPCAQSEINSFTVPQGAKILCVCVYVSGVQQ